MKSDGKRTSQRAESFNIEGNCALGGCFDTAVSTFFCPETKEGKSSPLLCRDFLGHDTSRGGSFFTQRRGGRDFFDTSTNFCTVPRMARLRSRNLKCALLVQGGS